MSARYLSKPLRRSLIAAALVLAVSASAQKLPWRAREGDFLGDVTRVLLVAPDVHVDKWTATSGEELGGTSDHVRRTICGELDDVFERRKLQVTDYDFCLGEGEASRERIEALRAVRLRFRDLVTAWQKPEHRNDLLPTFHLGEEQEEIKKLDSDVMILVTADGNINSRGARAREFMGGGPGASQGLLIHFGVIRVRTGELLFFTEKFLGGDFLKHEEKMEEAIQKAVQSAFAPPAK